MIAAFFDTKIKVYNAISQKEIATLDHMFQINLNSIDYNKVLVYKEEATKDFSSDRTSV